MQIILQGKVTGIADEKLYDKVEVQVSTQRLSGKVDVIRVLMSDAKDLKVGDFVEVTGYIKFLAEQKSLCVKAQSYIKLDELPTQQKNLILGEAKLAKALSTTKQNDKAVGRLHLVDKWENEINCSVWGDNITLCEAFTIGDTIDIVGRLHSHIDTSSGSEKYVTEISVLKLRMDEEVPSVTIKVNLNAIESVRAFVSAAYDSNCDILLVSGIYRINGKSILGVFSLDLSKDVECHVKGEKAEIDRFLDKISKVRKE